MAILKMILFRTMSQCNFFNTGVMRSLRRLPSVRYISVSISIPLLTMYFNSFSIKVLQCISVSISIRKVFQFQFCFTSSSVFISVIEFVVLILCGINKQISKLMYNRLKTEKISKLEMCFSNLLCLSNILGIGAF